MKLYGRNRKMRDRCVRDDLLVSKMIKEPVQACSQNDAGGRCVDAGLLQVLNGCGNLIHVTVYCISTMALMTPFAGSSQLLKLSFT